MENVPESFVVPERFLSSAGLVEQQRYQVLTADASKLGYESLALGRVVPEKELALSLFLAVCPCGIDRLHGVGIDAGVEYLRAQSHWSGRKVLYLLQLEVEAFGYYGQHRHILFGASGMAAYEIGYELLSETAFLVYFIKCLLELLKMCERWFAHQFQNGIRCVFGGYLETAAYMSAYQFTGVIHVGPVGSCIRIAVLQYVISDAAAYAGLFYSRHLVGSTVKVCKGGQVCTEIGTDLGRKAGGAFTVQAFVPVPSSGSVHVGRRTSQVRYITLEILHLCYLAKLLEDTLLAAAHNLFALMGRNGAE